MPPPARPIRRPRTKQGRRAAPGMARILGGLDRVDDDGTLEGWCWAPDAPAAQRTVAVTIDGHVVARAACDRPRPDLAQAGVLEGDHGFLLRLAPGLLRPGSAVEVALRDVATGQLVGRPVQVTWGTVTARGAARAAAAPRPPLSGNLDRVTRDGWVSGWCWDPHDPGRRVTLDVLVDGAVVGSTQAANWRADLQQAGIGDGSHGFAYALAYEVLARAGTLRISVQEHGGGRLLGDPVTLRIGRLAESEQRLQALEQQVRRLGGRLDAFERQARTQPEAEERAARALFATVAGFFRELAEGTAEDARGYGAGAGLRATLDQLTARLPALTLRPPPREPAALVIVPATEPVEAVHRCLSALHEAQVDAQAELLLLDPGEADARTALLPSLVSGLRYRQVGAAGLAAACNEALRGTAAPLLAVVDPRVEVTVDWLEALRRTLADEPEAGLVGGAVLRGDGLLQHAGFMIGPGAVLHDPAQFAEADRSAWRALRAVDAVAALAFAATADRVAAVGGFDALYRGLPHATAALCARLREAGHAVLVQPAAAALWAGLAADPQAVAPATDGSDEDARRLRLALLHPPEGPEAARAPAGHALVVDDAVPRPDRDAGSVIALAQMGVLRRLGWQVTFAPAASAAVAEADRRRLEFHGIEVALPPEHPSVLQYLRDHGAALDLVQVVRHANAAALAPPVRELAPRARLLFAPADLHYLREAREAAVLGTRPPPGAQKRARARELACARAADATLVLSDHEQALLAEEVAPDKLFLLRWIAEPAPPGPDFAAREGLLFVGNFAHRPNVDAVRWYAEAILPPLRRLRPGLVLHVAGADPPPEIAGLAGPELVVHGWVRDLDALLARVRLSVAPLRYGAGFKGKVATSLAHGVPVVGTPIALEGTGLAEGDGVAIARAPEAFARSIVRLHDDAATWVALSRRAVERVTALYSPAAAEAIYRRLLASLDLPFR